MNLNTLHLFVAVIQYGSLSKASERTGVNLFARALSGNAKRLAKNP